MTTKNNTLSLRIALQSGAGAAETQLAIIAENAGDSHLQAVVADFKPAEIAVMVSDADMTKPSLAHSFITEEQFMGAFSRLGSRWGEVQTSVDYVSFQRDVEDFLCPMILASDDPVRRTEMLAALVHHELGTETLLFMAVGHKEGQALLAHPHGFPITRGTWQELLVLTYEKHPAQFHEIAGMARDIYKGGDEAVHNFAYSVLSALYDEARSHQVPEEIDTEEFVDI